MPPDAIADVTVTKRHKRQEEILMFTCTYWAASSFAGVLHNNLANFPDVVRVKKKEIKISFSRWWRLELATSPNKTHL